MGTKSEYVIVSEKMAAPVKIEFAVRMTCSDCVDAIKSSLVGKDGIRSVAADLGTEQVIVETTLSSQEVQDMIESSGRRAVLQGIGSHTANHLGAAVVQMFGPTAKGVTRLVQTDQDTCVIEGTIDNLSQGQHGLFIHELGDLSEGCSSCGDVFDGPLGRTGADGQPVGNLGVINAQDNGRAHFRMQTDRIKVWDVIGRSMVVHDRENDPQNLQQRIGCGIIARSAGLLENSKRICACDGVTIWDERDVPAAGPERARHRNNSRQSSSQP